MPPALLLRDPPASRAAPPAVVPASLPNGLSPAWEQARRLVAVRLPDAADAGGMQVLHQLLTAPPPGPELAEDADLAAHHRGEWQLRLAAELAAGGQPRLHGAGAPLYLALPLRGAVAALAALGEAALPLIGGIEISCAEAATDLPGFDALRAATAARGIALALGGIGGELLSIATPEALGADLLVLRADAALAECGARLARLREGMGAARLLLAGTDSEEWLRWGVAQRIRRFRGGRIDTLLAAARRLVCAHAGQCPLTACAARAAFMGAENRAGCRNLALLDRAA